MFLIKIVQKITGNQKAWKKQSKKSREIRVRIRQKGNKPKAKSVKEICQHNFERKRFIQSFKSRDEILKLKIKTKNIQ